MLQLSYTTLVAPESGRIAKKTVETGQHVDPGQALLAVVSADRWIVANFKENQLSEMRASQVVEVKIDAIHGRRFRGHVESFAPGTGAEFALLPPDNATGNFTKIVQRVPVKILLEPNDVRELGGRIAPGLSAIATVRVKE
jgi:membrane fusion protein (multidrug efflux system)